MVPKKQKARTKTNLDPFLLQDINQEMCILCSDGREIEGTVVSIGDKGCSITILTSDGRDVELKESEIEAIWAVPAEDTASFMLGNDLTIPIASFYKDRISLRVWKVDLAKQIAGPMLFTFDRKKIYNFWSDYPQKLMPEEIEVFEEDNPYWANFHEHRKKQAQEMLKKKKTTK